MAITVLHLAIYLQAYHSTKFDPSKILVWMPLILIIDAGSMVQVWVLVAEEGELMARLKLPFRSDSHKNPTIAEQKKREKAKKEEEGRHSSSFLIECYMLIFSCSDQARDKQTYETTCGKW